MSARPKKHSLTLKGHRTSVSLEDEFWQAFRDIAAIQDQPINVLAAKIDAQRTDDAGRINTGLASAIRLYVLRYYRDAPMRTPDNQ
jgi:predicted DNA-binding ribbon-helix-helix protein